MSLSPGSRLGPYQVLGPLGAGGMGEVYRARDTRLGRDVAVKVLPESVRESADALARFEREARAVAALSHPGVLTLFDVGHEGPLHYVVTELLEGETLRAWLGHTRPTWQRAVEISIAIAEGLAAAHAQGIIHRDLKPENVFLTSDGRVKILDFGLARIDAFDTTESTQTRTEPGTVLGTVGYMSPEQVRGQPTDARGDIFALGCVLYELATGVRAFDASSGAEIRAAILRDEPRDPGTGSHPIPRELSRLIAHCLEKSPDARFQSARDLAFGLRSVLAGATGAGPASDDHGSIDSLAVLPFANLSGDPEAEYLCDGIAGSILHSLSRLPGLRVMARTTLTRYQGKDVDPQIVGRELNVRALLSGRVFHRGEALAVKSELVDTRDGSLLWAGNYNRTLSDILAIEEQIAREISDGLPLKIAGEDAERLTRRPTQSIEAHRLYLHGSFYLSRRSSDGLQRGIQHFHEAIAHDPVYALPHAGIAQCYAMLGFYGYVGPEAFVKAKAAASRALELDADLAEARSALALARFYYDWDWDASEAGFREAVAILPTYAAGHQYYAIFLAAMGRHEECFAELPRAEDLDPLSLAIKTAWGWCRFQARRYDESIAGLEEAVHMDPGFIPFHHMLTWSYAARGSHEQAIEAAARAVALSDRGAPFLAALALAHAAAGNDNAASELLNEIAAVGQWQYVSPYQLATVYCALGQTDRALDELQAAVRSRDWNVVLLRVDPRVDPLREDPRFLALLHQVAL